MKLHKRLQKYLPVVIIGALVLLKAVRYLYFYQNSEPLYLDTDDAIYAQLASRFLNADYYGAFHPYWNPGFSLAQIPFYLILGSWESAQVILRLTSSLLLIVFTYLSIRKISETAAAIAGFLVTFSPAVDELTLNWGISEPLYVLLLYILAYFVFKSITLKNNASYFFSGLFFGIVYLIRTEVIASFGLFFIIIFLDAFTKRKASFRVKNLVSLVFLAAGLFFYFHFRTERGFYFAALALVLSAYFIFYKIGAAQVRLAIKPFIKVMILVLIPFFIVNSFYFATISKQLGKFSVSGKYAYALAGPAFKLEPRLYTTYAQDVWSIDFPNFQSKFYDTNATSEAAWKNLDISLYFFPKKLGENLGFYVDLFSKSGVIFVAISLVLILLYKKTRKMGLFFAVFLLVNLLWVSFSMEMTYRYVAFAFPFFLVIQSLGAWIAILYITKISQNQKTKALLNNFCVMLFFIAYITSFVNLNEFFTPKRKINIPDTRVKKEIVAWLKGNNVHLFMGRNEGVSFYADAKMVYLPQGIPEVIVNYAKAWGVQYILVRPSETSWDYMQEINSPDYKHPDISLVHKFGDNSLIWKVNLTTDEMENNVRTGVVKFRGPEVY